ncbi:TetR/AcrR family transcriptional regulator [Streptomyces sp. NPDC026672]|uniref:TetR/AcrR family transcriptional regulator n=1 Tax=unclassified Streptomyces TaxID=2593676 RepID=UPI0033C91F3A
MVTARTRTRDIARSAVRGELAQVAFGLFSREGFAKVTLDDLAAAAGVSRSTFLRYFGTKEEVVLSAFDPVGDRMAQALRERPADEDDWTALRRSLDPAVDHFAHRSADSITMLRLVQETPALCARLRDKQVGWRPGLVDILVGRPGAGEADVFAARMRVGATLECLILGLERWVETDGRLDLGTIVDDAFAALTGP